MPRTCVSAAAPGLPDEPSLSRRSLLAALPAAGAALALPEMAKAEEEQTPILRLFREMEQIDTQAESYETVLTGEDEDAELDRLFYNRRAELEAEMMALPCTCAADFAAKVIIETCYGEVYLDWETGAIGREARHLIGSTLSI